MGLWDKIVGSIERAAGQAAEWIGKKTGSAGLQEKGREWQRHGNDLINGIAKEAGKTNPYDRDSATVEATIDVNEILSGFSMGLQEQCNTLEASAKKLVEHYFDMIIDAMEKVSELNQNVRNLRYQKDLALPTIDNILSNHLARRVSTGDNECMRIMQMQKGSEKEEQMRQFGKKVIQEGLDTLCGKLDEVIDTIQSSISKELDELSAAKKSELESVIAQLRQIIEKRQDDKEDSESAMLAPAQKLGASEVALEVIQGA